MHRIERFDNAPQADFLAVAHMRPRVRHQQRNAQCRAARYLFDEQPDAPLSQSGLRRSQVDQVTVVTHRLLERQPPAMRLPLLSHLVAEGGEGPLLLVLREDLHGLHPKFLGVEQGVVHAAGNGEMGAEHAPLPACIPKSLLQQGNEPGLLEMMVARQGFGDACSCHGQE